MNESINIPDFFSSEGMFYSLLKRNSVAALYVVSSGSGEVVGYELHLVRKKEGGKAVLNGKEVIFRSGEFLATTSEFGRFAWFFPDKERALNLLDKMPLIPRKTVAAKIRKKKI